MDRLSWRIRRLLGFRPRSFAEYMATPAKRAQRDQLLAMCDRMRPPMQKGNDQ